MKSMESQREAVSKITEKLLELCNEVPYLSNDPSVNEIKSFISFWNETNKRIHDLTQRVQKKEEQPDSFQNKMEQIDEASEEESSEEEGAETDVKAEEKNEKKKSEEELISTEEIDGSETVKSIGIGNENKRKLSQEDVESIENSNKQLKELSSEKAKADNNVPSATTDTSKTEPVVDSNIKEETFEISEAAKSETPEPEHLEISIVVDKSVKDVKKSFDKSPEAELKSPGLVAAIPEKLLVLKTPPEEIITREKEIQQKETVTTELIIERESDITGNTDDEIEKTLAETSDVVKKLESILKELPNENLDEDQGVDLKEGNQISQTEAESVLIHRETSEENTTSDYFSAPAEEPISYRKV